MALRRLLPFAALALLAACGSGAGDPTSGPDGAATRSADAATGVDGGDPGAEWITLLEKSWELPPISEDWQVVSRDLDEDIYARGIRPIAPLGTHHTLVSVGAPGELPTPELAEGTIYASGVGSNELMMPPGVGLRLPAGARVSAQLHLFNVSEEPLSGTSGIEVLPTTAGQVQHEAEIFLPGPLTLDIPPGEVVQSGTCTVGAEQTIFAIFPHMHQLGIYFRAVAHTGGRDVVLHDGPYTFQEQAILPLEPLALQPGDTITTECTYYNGTGETVTWGQSSAAEMCFSILFRYPRFGGLLFC